jgi:hypothetical protein
MRSAVAVCYGDSSDRVALREEAPGGKPKSEVRVMRNGTTVTRAVLSLMHANGVRFSEWSNGRSRRYCAMKYRRRNP